MIKYYVGGRCIEKPSEVAPKRGLKCQRRKTKLTSSFLYRESHKQYVHCKLKPIEKIEYLISSSFHSSSTTTIISGLLVLLLLQPQHICLVHKVVARLASLQILCHAFRAVLHQNPADCLHPVHAHRVVEWCPFQLRKE